MKESKDARDHKRKIEAKERQYRRLMSGISQGEAATYPGRGALVCAVCGLPTLDHPVAVMCGTEWVPQRGKK